MYQYKYKNSNNKINEIDTIFAGKLNCCGNMKMVQTSAIQLLWGSLCLYIIAATCFIPPPCHLNYQEAFTQARSLIPFCLSLGWAYHLHIKSIHCFLVA